MSSVPTPRELAKLHRRKAVVALVAAGALAAPVVARADPGTAGVSAAPDAAYPSPGPTVLGKEPTSAQSSVPFGASASSPAAADNGGDAGNISSLPFTGFAAGGVVLLALAMIGVGFALRRASRTP